MPDIIPGIQTEDIVVGLWGAYRQEKKYYI